MEETHGIMRFADLQRRKSAYFDGINDFNPGGYENPNIMNRTPYGSDSESSAEPGKP